MNSVVDESRQRSIRKLKFVDPRQHFRKPGRRTYHEGARLRTTPERQRSPRGLKVVRAADVPWRRKAEDNPRTAAVTAGFEGGDAKDRHTT
ncbi:hypothetical protein A2U01_0006150 [Trifolium medium]|uniref:Uncharacterized protein n=1 Tax=Trifolium medium TaxID=97028 RepID=A0A392MCW5_9FABA|nr:hypothetical protein [Trifolium medium]